MTFRKDGKIGRKHWMCLIMGWTGSNPVASTIKKHIMPYYIKRKKKSKSENGIKVKRKTDYTAKLDKVFSLYIRLRDCMPNGYFRCISCGKIKPFEQADCGHFHSRRHMSTRFDEDNAHAECRFCNRFSADHLINYEKNLIAKIGQSRFDKLSWKAGCSKKWSDFELKELIKYYTILNEKLTKEKEI